MKKLWVLIYVHHGLIQKPELFVTRKNAIKRKKEILKNFNRDYDEVEIFSKEI